MRLALVSDIHGNLPAPEAVATGSPEARYALVEKQDGTWNAQIILVPYDAEPMARLAERNGRPTWAQALRQGVC